MDCENCGNADMSFSAEWLGHHVCYECNQRGFGLASDYRARAEKAEAERDEARREAVMVLSAEIFGGALEALSCLSPAGVLSSGLDRWITGDLDEDEEGPAEFLDEAEALSAGRALPWWEVKA